MKKEFITGDLKVNKYGDDNFTIKIFNKFNNEETHLNFLSRHDIWGIVHMLNKVLKEGETCDHMESQLSKCEINSQNGIHIGMSMDLQMLK